MECESWSKACIVASTLAASLFAGGCAVMEPRAESYVPQPEGSTWTISQRNTGSYGRDAQFQVTRGEGTWQGQRVLAFKSSLGPTTFARPEDGKFLAVVAPDGKEVAVWNPPIGWEFPITVGKKWTSNMRLTNRALNRTATFDWSCTVESYGDITVAAGTFKTFRIDCATTIGLEETWWYSPDLRIVVKSSFRRSSASPFGAGTQDAELVSQDIRR
jgi:hypothetical protein